MNFNYSYLYLADCGDDCSVCDSAGSDGCEGCNSGFYLTADNECDSMYANLSTDTGITFPSR